MDVLDVNSALSSLIRHNVTHSTDLSDYHLSQCYRSLAHAAATDPHHHAGSQPYAGVGVGRGGTTSKSDGLPPPSVQLVRSLCETISDSPKTRRCVVFLCVQLLLEDGSSYGLGNDVPSCREHFSLAIGQVIGEVWDPSSVARRRQLSLARLLTGAVSLLSATLRRGKGVGDLTSINDKPPRERDDDTAAAFLVTHCSNFAVDVLLRVALPRLAVEASTAAASYDSKSGPPTRLAVELNAAIVSIASHVLRDILLADRAIHQRHSEPKSLKPRPLLTIDLSVQDDIWRLIPLLRNALSRHANWMKASSQSLPPRPSSSEDSLPSVIQEEEEEEANDEEQGGKWLLEDLLRRADEHLLHPLRSVHERTAAIRLQLVQQFGSHAKDVGRLDHNLWMLALQAATAALAMSSGFLRTVVQGVDYSRKDVDRDVCVGLLSALSNLPALQAEAETEEEGMHATHIMVEASSMLLFYAPLHIQRRQLWSADAAVTQQVHNLIVSRALRYHKTPTVVHFATMFSFSILQCANRTIHQDLMQSSGEQLLGYLSDSRGDGATQSAIQVVAFATLQRPHTMIPSLFRLLDQGSSRAARQNAFDVLQRLPQSALHTANRSERKNPTTPSHSLLRNSERDASPSGDITTTTVAVVRSPHHREETDSQQQQQLRDAMRILAEHLLMRLGEHEELHEKLLAASLFRLVDPTDVLSPLIKAMLQRDTTGNRRGPATKAFHALISSRVEWATPVTQWLDALRSVVSWCQEEFEKLEISSSLNSNNSGTRKLAKTSQQGAEPQRQDDDDKQAGGSPAISHSSSSSTSRVPRTPGDIAAYAMLHVPSSLNALLTDTSEQGIDKDESNTSGDSPSPSSPSSPSSLEALQGRLTTLVVAAAQNWATAAHHCVMLQTSISYDQRLERARALVDDELLPWLRGLQRTEWLQTLSVKLFVGVVARFAAAVTSSAAGSHDSMRTATPPAASSLLWATVCLASISRALSAVMVPARSLDVDTAAPVGEEGATTPPSTTAEASTNVVTGAATSECLLFQQLLPYLWMRTLPGSWVTTPVVPPGRLELEGSDSQSSSGGGVALAAEWQSSVHTIVHATLLALAQSQRSADRQLQDPQVQRVQLECICRFPASLVLPMLSECQRLPHLSEESSAWMTNWWFRVRLFVVCRYGMFEGPDGPWRDDRVVSLNDVLLAQPTAAGASSLLDRCRSTVCTSSFGRSQLLRLHPPSSTPNPQWSEEEVKLNIACLDTLSVVLLAATMNCPPSTRTTTKTTTEGDNAINDTTMGENEKEEKEEPAAVTLWRQLQQRVIQQQLRDPIDKFLTSSVVVEMMGETETECLVALRILENSTQMMRGATRSTSRAWVGLWLGRHQSWLIASANTAVTRWSREERSSATEAGRSFFVQIACRCAEVLFHAVMAATGRPSSSSSPNDSNRSSTSENDGLSSERSARWLDSRAGDTALLSFAFGCCAYDKLPLVQFAGVKLLTALMSVAPEVLASYEQDDSIATSSQRRPLPSVLSSMTDIVGEKRDGLDLALRRLQSIAMAHQIPEARRLAENVVLLLSSHRSNN